MNNIFVKKINLLLLITFTLQQMAFCVCPSQTCKLSPKSFFSNYGDLDGIVQKVELRFADLDRYNLTEEEKKEVRSYKSQVLNLLKQISLRRAAQNISFDNYIVLDESGTKKALVSGKIAKIGLFLGSFDPPHIGHLVSALTHIAEGVSDHVVFMARSSSKYHPKSFKSTSDFDWRVKLLEKTLEDFSPLIHVSQFKETLSPLDVTKFIRTNRKKELDFSLIIGNDVFRNLNILEFRLLSLFFKIVGGKNFKLKLHVIQRKGTAKITEKMQKISEKTGLEIYSSTPPITSSSSTFKNTNHFNLYPATLEILTKEMIAEKYPSRYLPPAQHFHKDREELRIPEDEQERRTQIVKVLTECLERIVKGRGRVINQGSVGRMTDLPGKFDVDLAISYLDYHSYTIRETSLLYYKVSKALKKYGYTTGRFRYRPAITGKFSLVLFQVFDEKGTFLTTVEVALQAQQLIYADFYQCQIEQIRERFGEEGVTKITEEIALMKRFLKNIKAYKWYNGGLKGVGAEQLIIQSGGTRAKGRIITGLGSFDRAMNWIYRIGLDEYLHVVPLSEAKKKLAIHNYENSENRLEALNELTWNRLVSAAKIYIENRNTGTVFSSLKNLEERVIFQSPLMSLILTAYGSAAKFWLLSRLLIGFLQTKSTQIMLNQRIDVKGFLDKTSRSLFITEKELSHLIKYTDISDLLEELTSYLTSFEDIATEELNHVLQKRKVNVGILSGIFGVNPRLVEEKLVLYLTLRRVKAYVNLGQSEILSAKTAALQFKAAA